MDQQYKTKSECAEMILSFILAHKAKQQKPSAEARINTLSIWGNYYDTQDPLRTDIESTLNFSAAVKDLEYKGLLKGTWDPKQGIYTKIIVSNEQAIEIAALQGVLLKDAFYAQLARVLDEFKASACPLVAEWCAAAPMSAVKSFCRYSTGTQAELEERKTFLRTLLRCSEVVGLNQEDILERNLSMRLGLGSKGFASAYRDRVASILSPYESKDKIQSHKILRQFHVLKNPAMVTIRGDAVISMKNGDRLSLGYYNSPISLGVSIVEQIDHISAAGLYSVENLTTFHDLPLKTEGLVVFTSGYPSTLTLHLMEKVMKDNALSDAYHCGDMDSYGFLILRCIDEKLSGRVHGYRMGMKEYCSHIDQSICMTDGNRAQFQRMLDDSYYTEEHKQFFRRLLQDGRTLEQESLSCY